MWLLTRAVTCGFAGLMSRLRIEKVDGDASVHTWQHVHNLVIPTHYRSLDEVRERSGHNVLEVAYLDDTLIGCTTVRPPSSETPAATVIARVLPGHRGQGFGTELYERGLAAERTSPNDTPPPSGTVHLRSRGEDADHQPSITRPYGSPPLARRGQRGQVTPPRQGRSTSARAESSGMTPSLVRRGSEGCYLHERA